MENYINHLRPVKFPLAGVWPVWDFGGLISALSIRNGLGAATCASEQRWGGIRFYFGTAELRIFRAELESHQWIQSLSTTKTLCPTSQAPHIHKVPYVRYFHVHRGSFLNIFGVPDATGQFSTFLPITALWCSHISHLHLPLNGLKPQWSFLRIYHWQCTAKTIITPLFSCSRHQWSAVSWGETQCPSTLWEIIPHLLPNKRC